MNKDISTKKCGPCEGNMEKLSPQEAVDMIDKHTPEWLLLDDSTKIKREFKFKNFKQALAFVNKVGEIAEEEGHHPDIEFGWGYARIILQTHAINGLQENDFIIAAKIDRLSI